MPYPAGHRERIKQTIVRSAQALFNRHGFESVSIDDVMARAGLTRGGFYSYFKTKSDLYAESVALVLTDHPVRRWDDVSVDFAAKDAAQQIVRAYLSRQHFDDVEESCPMVALPSDISRAAVKVRQAFQEVFEGMAGVIERGLERAGRPDKERALAIAALCVGGMVVARSVVDPQLANTLRAPAAKSALELGGWTTRGKRRRGRVGRHRSRS